MYGWQLGGTHPIGMLSCLVTACKRSFRQGNIFSSVCQEFCSQGGLPQCMLGYHLLEQTPPGADTPQDQASPGPGTDPGRRHPSRIRHPLGPGTTPRSSQPPRNACWEIRSTSRRYASYWNVILFIKESSQIFIAGKPYEPNDFHVVMETSISVTVQWKAGFAAGYGPQTFRLEYKNATEKGTDNLICSWFVLLISKEILWFQKDPNMPSTTD